MLNKAKISQIVLTVLIIGSVSFGALAGAVAYQGISGALGFGLSATQTI